MEVTDLYESLEEVLDEDFQTDYALARNIIKNAYSGSFRDIFFMSLLIDDLKDIEYRGDRVETYVLKWDTIPKSFGITPYGRFNEPEFKLSSKGGIVTLNDTPTSLKIDEVNVTIYGIWDRLEKSVFMTDLNSVNLSRANIIYRIDETGRIEGWSVKKDYLPKDIAFALAEAESKGYGGFIRNNTFYPCKNYMFEEHLYRMNVSTPNQQEKYNIMLRAKNFFRLAGNFMGSVMRYLEEDNKIYDPRDTKVIVPKHLLLDLKENVSLTLLETVMAFINRKNIGSFVIFPVGNGVWKIRESKYYQPGDRIISYSLLDRNRLKIDVNLGNVFFDYFLSKTYLYYISKRDDGKIIVI
ncbi:MAG: hypothetical protein NZ908_01465 [Candidatus Micrarchaeota archaeon]|nr:hypothetical protein [Candidatus Micrarchaeota archaeon]